MIILPAIDLLDGQVVRLREGKLEDKTVYSDDPLGICQALGGGGRQLPARCRPERRFYR